MSYTLNTGHALYANLIDLIGVQGGALVSHKTARTFTPHALATYGSGTWGEHFKTGPKGWNFSGATFTPDLAYDTSGGKGFTIFYAVNNIATAAENLGALHQGSTTYGVSVNGQRAVAGNSSSDPYQPLTTVGVGAKSMCVTRNGEISNKSYVDGILEYTGGQLGWNNPVDGFNSIGGFDGQGVAGGIEFVWVAAFDKILSDAEVLALHNSLGASNAFALVSSGGGDTTAPTLTSPSVTSVGATTGTGNVTTNEGNGTLYSIVSTSATAPSATQIQAGQNHTGAAAAWSGNQTVSSTGAKTFSLSGLSPSTAYYFHAQHKDAANNNSTVVTSAQFTTTSGAATAPGATLVGTSSLTPGGASGSAAGTASGANLTGTSSISAGSATGGAATGSFTTQAMENNSGAGLLASTAVVWTWYQGAIGSAPTSTTHGTGTTNSSGILTAAGLPIAAGFLLVRTSDSSGVYYESGTPA